MLTRIGSIDYERASADALYERVRRSDAQAFQALYELMREPLYRYVCRFTNADEAYDVLQDVFLTLWDRRKTQEVRVGVRPFLYRSARNRALNVRRKMNRVELPGELPDQAIPGAESIDPLAGRVQEWLDGLPPRRSEAFMLSRYHDLSHAQIARVMQLSPRTVQTHIVHALRDLRRALADWTKFDEVRP